MADTFIVVRGGAFGDVILTTPIVRRLRWENPDAVIKVVTGYPMVYANNPHIVDGDPTGGHEIYIHLDGAYERRPHLHIVQAYMQEAFGDTGEPNDLQQELGYSVINRGFKPRRNVAVHAAVAGWANRTLPRETWRDVINGIHAMDLWPVMVGSPRDVVTGVTASNLLSMNFLLQASMIETCSAFIGSDSAMLHVAGATEVPIVGIFTCAKPETRLPFRHGQLGWNCTTVVPDLDCIGCLARREPPVTSEHCERGDTVCVESISAAQILAALQKTIEARQLLCDS